MGSRDHTSLSKDSILACRHTDRFTRWEWNVGEVSEEQTETNYFGARREVGKRIEGCQICWMFGIDTGLFASFWKIKLLFLIWIFFLSTIAERIEKCIWWSDIGRTWTTRTSKKEAMQNLVRKGLSPTIIKKKFKNTHTKQIRYNQILYRWCETTWELFVLFLINPLKKN